MKNWWSTCKEISLCVVCSLCKGCCIEWIKAQDQILYLKEISYFSANTIIYNKRCKPVLMMWPESTRAKVWRHSCSLYSASVAQAWHYTFHLSWGLLAIFVAKNSKVAPPDSWPAAKPIFWRMMIHHTWPWPLAWSLRPIITIGRGGRGHPGAFICCLTLKRESDLK